MVDTSSGSSAMEVHDLAADKKPDYLDKLYRGAS